MKSSNCNMKLKIITYKEIVRECEVGIGTAKRIIAEIRRKKGKRLVTMADLEAYLS